MRRSLHAAAAAALTASLAACGAGEATVIAADGPGFSAEQSAVTSTPVRSRPCDPEFAALERVAVGASPAKERSLAEAGDRLAKQPGTLTVRRIDRRHALIRYRGPEVRSVYKLFRQAGHGWRIAGSLSVPAGCASSLDAEFARPGEPLRPSKGSSGQDGEPGKDGKLGTGTGGQGGDGGTARVRKSPKPSERPRAIYCGSSSTVHDHAADFPGRPTVAAAIPAEADDADSLTVRRVDKDHMLVRARRGNELTVYRINRSPDGGWKVDYTLTGDVRCPGDFAKENARPGTPIKRAR